MLTTTGYLMKHLFALVLIAVLSPIAFACDEDCKRERAMAEHGVTFPSYLNARFCEDTRVEFLLRGRRNLQQYYDQHLQSGHRGGMRNIHNFIQQRIEWLQECDEYLRLTDQGRIFRNEETTAEIFEAMQVVSQELDRLVYRSGATGTYVSDTGEAPVLFDQLFGRVDAHVTDLQLRGQLVIR